MTIQLPPMIITAIALLMMSIGVKADDAADWRQTPVEVKGSAEFRTQIEAALKLIKEKAPEAYALVQNNVAIITEGERSGMWAYKNPPTYEISKTSAFHSVTWCAGAIAHDAYHSKLYHDYVTAKGKPVPAEIWTGQEVEKICIAFQLSVLKKIGGPKDEVDYCLKLNGKHYDVNQDGKYTWEDYFKRKW